VATYAVIVGGRKNEGTRTARAARLLSKFQNLISQNHGIRPTHHITHIEINVKINTVVCSTFETKALSLRQHPQKKSDASDYLSTGLPFVSTLQDIARRKGSIRSESVRRVRAADLGRFDSSFLSHHRCR
jgi:hypothetical protein